MVERYAIFLNGEQISPSFKTGDEASRWGAERYDVADDRVSIGVVYEETDDEQKNDIPITSSH